MRRRHPDLRVPEAGAGGPCRGWRLGEALISQWLWEGLVTSRWAGLRPLNPVPVPPLRRPGSLAASHVCLSVCPRGGWGGSFPGFRKGEEWGWLSGPGGRWRSWARQGPQVREQRPPPSTSAGGAADSWGAAAWQATLSRSRSCAPASQVSGGPLCPHQGFVLPQGREQASEGPLWRGSRWFPGGSETGCTVWSPCPEPPSPWDRGVTATCC